MKSKVIVSIFALSLLCFPIHGQQQIGSGPLDLSFGSGGRVNTSFGVGIPGYASAVIIQPDGKILTAGVAGISSALARYNVDGSLDSSFGSDGRVTNRFFGYGAGASSVLLQPDGKIVTGGYAYLDGSTGVFALARYNSDGSPDSSFGVEGRANTGFGSRGAGVSSLGLLPDGKIVAAGGRSGDYGSGGSDFALARYNKDGSLDTSFGIEGKLTTDFFGGQDGAGAVIIQPDGKIVAIGSATLESKPVLAAVRYNASGSLDSRFGSNGKFTSDFLGRGAEASAGILQPDGKMLLAGISRTQAAIYNYDFGLMRLNPDGGLDSTFGDGGKVSIDFFGYDDWAISVALQRNGKIVLCGVVSVEMFRGNFRIARLNNNGTVDASFGDAGSVILDFSNSGAQGIAIQADGKIVVAGGKKLDVTDIDFALARFDSSRPLIESASVSGKRLIISGTGFEEDAKILVNDKEQKTINNRQNPATGLVGKKAGKKLRVGDKIRVFNSDGALSPEFTFSG
jgi:uncharacterized delta-60 repeat protein